MTATPEPPAKRGSRSKTARTADDYDETLFEQLRNLRRQIADERDVPAYVIFPDTTLRAIARDLPCTLSALRGIGGVGDKKLADFGEPFVNAVVTYTQGGGSDDS